MTVATLPLSWASDAEQALASKLMEQLTVFQVKNDLKRQYREGKIKPSHVGIAAPPSMRDVMVSIGWAGTAVDVMNDRLEWYGWGDNADLAEIYRDNQLDVEVSQGFDAALTYGTSFLVVGDGLDGESHPLITHHEPFSMTGVWDRRLRRLSSAAVVRRGENGGAPAGVTLYLPDETVQIDLTRGWYVEDRYRHGFGRVPVIPVGNQGVPGRSEITRPIRYLVDEAVRTMLDMSTHRSFFAAPQRYALNVAEDQFKKPDGTTASAWETVMGRIWALPYDEDRPEGQDVQVGQFSSSSPTGYVEQLRVLAEMFSAETGIPVDDLGVQRANPTSEGALIASEKRLIRKTEARQRHFTHSLDQLAELALLVRDRSVPDLAGVSANHWRAAATPTRAAIADETVKYVAAGILPPDSKVTWSRMGLTPTEQEQLAADQRRSRAAGMIAALNQPEITGGVG